MVYEILRLDKHFVKLIACLHEHFWEPVPGSEK